MVDSIIKRKLKLIERKPSSKGYQLLMNRITQEFSSIESTNSELSSMFVSLPSTVLLHIFSYFRAPSHFLHVTVLNKAINLRFHREEREFWLLMARQFRFEEDFREYEQSVQDKVSKWTTQHAAQLESESSEKWMKRKEDMEKSLLHSRQLFLKSYRYTYRFGEIYGLVRKVKESLNPQLWGNEMRDERMNAKIYFEESGITNACNLLSDYATEMNGDLVKEFCNGTTKVRITSRCSWGPNSYLSLESLNFFYNTIFVGAIPLVKMLIRISPKETIYKVLSTPCEVCEGSDSYQQYNFWNEDEAPRPAGFQTYSTEGGGKRVNAKCKTAIEFMKALLKVDGELLKKKREIEECLEFISGIQVRVDKESDDDSDSESDDDSDDD